MKTVCTTVYSNTVLYATGSFLGNSKNQKTYFVKDSLKMISNDFGGDKLKFVGEDRF